MGRLTINTQKVECIIHKSLSARVKDEVRSGGEQRRIQLDGGAVLQVGLWQRDIGQVFAGLFKQGGDVAGTQVYGGQVDPFSERQQPHLCRYRQLKRKQAIFFLI